MFNNLLVYALATVNDLDRLPESAKVKIMAPVQSYSHCYLKPVIRGLFELIRPAS